MASRLLSITPPTNLNKSPARIDIRSVSEGSQGCVEQSDIKELLLFLPGDSWFSEIINQNHDFFYSVGATGLGLSLFLIHIYVTEIKRTLQALWVITWFIMLLSAVWFVGPLFVALTGLVFKQGLCYGKLEAGLLTFIIPSLLLGHLSVLMGKLVLLGTWMAGRKFTQPIKDDIGDKSVFMFMSLSEDEKKARARKFRIRTTPSDNEMC